MPATPAPAALPARVRAYLADARAANTRKTYHDGWKAFTRWRGHGRLPATPEEVAAFAAHLADSGYRPSTIRTRLAAIAATHRAHAAADPTPDRLVRDVVDGIARRHGDRPRQAASLTESEVAALKAVASPRDRAILLVARDSLARASELVALDVADVDLQQQTVCFTRSKRDQHGHGELAHLGPAARDAVARLLGERTAGPLFHSRTGRRLHPNDVRRTFKRLARRAGLDASRVSGHSPRIGMALDLARAGASVVELQQAGRWRAPSMPAHYTQGEAPHRGPVARLRAGDLPRSHLRSPDA